MINFCVGRGLYDSRSEAGQDYDTATFEALDHLLANPQPPPKDEAYWAIFSIEHGPDARRKSKQLENGQFCALALDMDEGHIPKDALIAALKNLLGDYRYLFYTTASSTQNALRWRVIIPTSELMPAQQYQWMQRALFETVAAVFKPDRRLEHASQIIFLPVRGEAYDYAIVEGPLFPPNDHPLLTRAFDMMQAAPAPSTNITKSLNGARGWFNTIYPTEGLLQRYAFKTLDGINWRSPYQTSKSYATRVHDDGSWLSLSGSDAEHNLGSKANGGQLGDAFDLFQHFEEPQAQACANAIGYGWQLGQSVEWAKFYIEKHTHVGRQLFVALEISTKSKVLKFLAANPLPDKPARHAQYTSMPEPRGNLLMVASWIYNSMMVDPQRDMAIIYSWVILTSFLGRKDSLKGNAPVLNYRVMALNGAGKDTCRSAREKILGGLRERAIQNNDLSLLNSLRCFDQLTPAFGTRRMALDALRTLSSVMILSEAGIAGKSKAGDAESIRAASMQNFAQSAYSRKSFKALADAVPDSYGSNISILEESTKETIIGIDQVSTGELARKLSFTIDASQIGDSRLHDSSAVPEAILTVVERLVKRAAINEDTSKTLDKRPAVASEPSPEKDRIIHELSPEAADRLGQLLQERTEFKRKNKENVADIAWAHRVRLEQAVMQHALAESIIENPWGNVVSLESVQAGEAVVRESRRTEIANETDYMGPLDRLVDAMKDFAIDQLKQPAPTATYKQFVKNWETAFTLRTMTSSIFTGSGKCRKHMAIAADMVAEKLARNASELFKLAAEYGMEQGIWLYHKTATGWYIDQVIDPSSPAVSARLE